MPTPQSQQPTKRAAPTEKRSSSQSAMSSGSEAPDADDGNEPSGTVDGPFGMHGGLLAFITKTTFAGLSLDFRYKTPGNHFEVQLPIGAGFGTLLSEPFQGRGRDLGAVATIGLQGGVVF